MGIHDTTNTYHIERNVDRIKCLYGQVNDGMFVTYEDIIDEDVLGHGPASLQTTRGRAALKKLDESYLTAYPDAKVVIQDIVAQGDKVVVRWNWSGTHEGVYKGIEPTHKKISVDGIHIYRFNHQGAVVEIWATHDRLGEFEQLGLFKLNND